MKSSPPLIRLQIVPSQGPHQLLRGLQSWQELGLLESSITLLAITVRQSGEPALQLSSRTAQHHLASIEALQTWYDLKLLNPGAMAVAIEVRSDHPQLLTGLGQWLTWGLLLPREVRVCAAQYLSSPLPEPPRLKPQPLPPRVAVMPSKPNPPQEPHPLQRLLSALLSELSVLWLLLLGVLLVVVSSGVLVASQWQNFPAAAQYSVLWLYTLGFGGASFWVQKQDHLRLTGQALPLVTLLLIPLNFLAMDSFHLGGSILGGGVLVLAAGSLSWLGAKLLKKPASKSTRLAYANYLILSYLHGGWAIAGIPLVATYGGVIVTAGVTLYRLRGKPVSRSSFSWGRQDGLLFYALLLLVLRAMVQLPWSQLGLAIALVGAIFLWLTEAETLPSGFSLWGYQFPSHTRESLGFGAMACGWWVAVETQPGSALIISFLGLGWGALRLGRTQKPGDFLALWLIGLQSLWLMGRLVPNALQATAIALGQQLAGLTTGSWALLSLSLFPYLVLTVFLTNFWQKKQQPQLARTAGQLATALGVCLTVLSFANPCLRTLNFLGSTALGLSLTHNSASPETSTDSLWTRASTRAGLSHGGLLLSIGALLDWCFPHLNLGWWAGLSLGLSLGETMWCLAPPSPLRVVQLIQAWAKDLALILGGIAHVLLAVNQGVSWFGGTAIAGRAVVSPLWGLSWGLIPLLWTGVACQKIELRGKASSWAIFSASLWQALTFLYAPSRWLGLGVATLVLLVNTSLAPNLQRTLLTVGVVLGFCFSGLQVAQLLELPIEKQGLLAALILLAGLWSLCHYLSGKVTLLARLYRQALDIWAYALATLMLLCLLRLSPHTILFTVPEGLTIGGVRETVLGLMVLSCYRSGQGPLNRFSIGFSLGVVLLAPWALWQDGVGYGLAMAIATGLLAWQTQRSGGVRLSIVSVGMALLLMVRLLWWHGYNLVSPWGLVLASLTAIVLWGFRQGVKGSALPKKECWSQALDYWGLIGGTIALGGLTLHSFLLYNGVVAASGWGIGAALLLLLGWGYRYGFEPRNSTVYALGGGVELLVVEVLGWTGRSLLMLALANVFLGLTTQILGDWWQKRGQEKIYLSSLHILPLLYGAMGASLRWGLFNRWTGLTTLGLVVIAVGVGRRRPEFKPLLYAALGGVSLSAYELLQYQIQGLPLGEQWLAWGALATTLLYAYGLLSSWLGDYLGLTTSELKRLTQGHWLLGTFCLGASLGWPLANPSWLGLGTGLFLTRYALWQGRSRQHPQQVAYWVYIGLAQGAAIAFYISRQFSPPLGLVLYLFPWIGILTSLVGIAVYLFPWARWHWCPHPWQQGAMVVPLVGLIPSWSGFYPVNFFAVAGFYGFLAYRRSQWPLTYLSLLFVDGGILKIWHHFGTITPFSLGLIGGISLFYIAWLEPHYRPTLGRAWGHPLRLVGTGLMGGLSLIYHGQPGWLPALLGILFIFAGLGLRIRAFLYGGTLTFLGITVYQLGILITQLPLLKWLLGLGSGLGFIWLAATFENQREKIAPWARAWLADLDTWQ